MSQRLPEMMRMAVLMVLLFQMVVVLMLTLLKYTDTFSRLK
jgi:hypothetical protein